MPLILKWPKGERHRLSENFKTTEFECPCQSPDCVEQCVDLELLTRLQDVRNRLKSSIIISRGGGFRCGQYQQKLRGTNPGAAKGLSQHELGRAADISTQNLDSLIRLSRRRFKAIGNGIEKYKYIHVDIRDEKKRRWTYS